MFSKNVVQNVCTVFCLASTVGGRIVTGMHLTGLPERNTDQTGQKCSKFVFIFGQFLDIVSGKSNGGSSEGGVLAIRDWSSSPTLQ